MSTWHLISVRLLAGVSWIENNETLAVCKKKWRRDWSRSLCFSKKVTHQLTDLKVEGVEFLFGTWKIVVGRRLFPFWDVFLAGTMLVPWRVSIFVLHFVNLFADIFCYANFFIGCKSGDIQGNQLIRDSHILSFPIRWPIWCRAPRCLCVPLKMTDAQKRAQGGPCRCVVDVCGGQFRFV